MPAPRDYLIVLGDDEVCVRADYDSLAVASAWMHLFASDATEAHVFRLDHEVWFAKLVKNR